MVEAAAFGRLCVETNISEQTIQFIRAAAFGRLCVETQNDNGDTEGTSGSRLRAAVC